MTDGPGDDVPVGAWLRQARLAAGLTQEELAERSGVSVRTISDLERGRTRRPHPRSVRSVISSLGLPRSAGDERLAHQRVAQTRAPEAPPGSGLQAPEIVPRQLPPGPGHFTGRAPELKALFQLLDGPAGATVVISAIDGTAGIGKTALAVHWAHRVAPRFPDGQLYVNLRGFDPTGAPVAPSEALRGFLDSLSVAPERIPVSLEAQVGLYRSLVADKRLLVLLDNARDAAQVRPLLPGSPGCLVVVTSRKRLAGLVAAEGACPLTLDVLSRAEAADLLAARLGPERLARQHGTAAELAEACARLPLALAVASARAELRPTLSLGALARELQDARHRLDALDAGEAATSVRAVFSWSYRQLSDPARCLFRLLGLHPGRDVTAPAAASLAAVSASQAIRALDELTSAHLLAEHAPGRFGFHDLLRAFAAEQVEAEDSACRRREAIHRIVDHYLHTAYGAERLLDPARVPITLAPPHPGVEPEPVAGNREAMAWFEAERQVLLAVIASAARAGLDIQAWQLPWTLATFFHRQGHWHDLAATQQIALAAAERLGDEAAQAQAQTNIGRAKSSLGFPEEALAHLSLALGLQQRRQDRPGQAKSHLDLAIALERQDRYAEALNHSQEALTLFRAAGDRVGEAMALNATGWYDAHLEGSPLALPACQEALELFCRLGDRYGEAHAWDSLGYVNHRIGQPARAVECYLQALHLFRESGDRMYEAAALVSLGDAHQASGCRRPAAEAWEQALAILEDLQHADADGVRDRLGNRAVAGDA